MAKATLPTNPTAGDVRAALGLPVQRGQLTQADIDRYNKGKRANKRYVRGAGVQQATAAREAAKAQRAALVKAGHKVGTRGPLPKAVLAQSKG